MDFLCGAQPFLRPASLLQEITFLILFARPLDFCLLFLFLTHAFQKAEHVVVVLTSVFKGCCMCLSTLSHVALVHPFPAL